MPLNNLKIIRPQVNDRFHNGSQIKIKWDLRVLSGKESTCNVGVTGDAGLIPDQGRSPGEGHGNPLQYSFLKNPIDREAWQATVHKVTKSQT